MQYRCIFIRYHYTQVLMNLKSRKPILHGDLKNHYDAIDTFFTRIQHAWGTRYPNSNAELGPQIQIYIHKQPLKITCYFLEYTSRRPGDISIFLNNERKMSKRKEYIFELSVSTERL